MSLAGLHSMTKQFEDSLERTESVGCRITPGTLKYFFFFSEVVVKCVLVLKRLLPICFIGNIQKSVPLFIQIIGVMFSRLHE